MDTNTIQNQIIEEFAGMKDRFDTYERLIDLGRSFTASDQTLRTDANAVSGCQSKVWISSEIHDGKVRYCADSDALITKGMIALLLRVLDNHAPSEILNTNLFFIERIGLSSSLSPARSNGLQAMVKKMHSDARQFQAAAG